LISPDHKNVSSWRDVIADRQIELCRFSFNRAIGSDPGRGIQKRNALKLFRRDVVRLRWNDSSHASPRIRVIIHPSGNKMNVTVHHSLTSDLPAIDSYVEPRHRMIRLANKQARVSNQALRATA
jgi:hypothetical protein